jgi:hypothetical protein
MLFPCLETIGSGFYQFILILSIDSLRYANRAMSASSIRLNNVNCFQGAERELDTEAFSGVIINE